MKPNLAIARLSVAALLFAVATAHAADYYWDAGSVTVDGVSQGGSAAWTVGAAGWEDGSIAQSWANGNTAILGGTAGTLTLGGAISATGITVQSSGYKVDGAQSLTAGALNIGSGASLEIANGGVALTWSGLAGSGTLTLNKSNSINVTASFNTADALNFTGSLVFRGGTASTNTASMAASWTTIGGVGLTQAAGTAFALDTGSATSDARDLIMTDAFNGATLQLTELKGFGTVRADWGNTGVRTIRVNQSTNTIFDGMIVAHRTSSAHRELVLQKAGAGILTLAGYLGHQTAAASGTGNLSVIVDGGALVMTNDSNNYAGSTTVNAGTLRIGDGGSTGTIGSSGAGAAGNLVTVASGAALEFNRSGTLDYKTNARMRHVAGGGDIVLSGGVKFFNYTGSGLGFADANSWSNFSGRLVIVDGSEFQTIRNGATAMGTAQVVLGDATTSGKLSQIEGNWTWTNNIQLVGSANEILNNATGSDRWNKLQGVLSGDGNLSLKDSTGAMNNGNLGFILTGSNTMSGTVTVDAFVRVGGVTGNDISTAAGTGGTLGIADVVINSGKRLTFSRSDTHVVANAISGAGTVHIGAPGITGTNTQDITLSGANDYTGGTELLQGTLRANELSAIGSGYLAVKNGSTFVYQGTGSETTTRNLFLDLGASNIEVTNASSTLTWNDAAAKNGAFTKSGAGTLVLGGGFSGEASVTVNGGTLVLNGAGTQTGVTDIQSGTLELGNASALANSSQVIVGPSTTLDVSSVSWTLAFAQILSGTGTIAGDAAIAGTLNPGSSAGTLTVNGNLDLLSTSVWNVEIGGTGLSAFDRIVGSGQLDAGGSIAVSLIDAFNPALNDSFQIAGFSSFVDSGYSFDFSNAALDPGLAWDTSSFGTTGTIAVIPEPGAALLGGIGLLFLLRRRRAA